MLWTIIIVILVVLVLVVVLMYNSLIGLRNKVDNSWAQIEVQLKRRYDLIPNLVSSVKGYMKHEKNLLVEVTKQRTQFMKAKTMEEKAKASNMLSETLKSLFAVAENYPNLKANENFIDLQQQLKDTEDKIAYSRQFYNDIVMVYNTRIQTVPTNIIANMFKFTKRDLFTAPEAERKAVKVEF